MLVIFYLMVNKDEMSYHVFMISSFPLDSKLKINELSRIFDSKSESYKLFWFGALLSKIREDKRELTFNELVDDMIATAWYMVSEFHLNLGPSDTMEKFILTLQDSTTLKPTEEKGSIISFLNSNQFDFIEKTKKVLINEVPYRILSTMVDLNSDDWKKGSKARIEMINRNDGLIYKFGPYNGLNTKIYIDNDWAKYIKQNSVFFEGWYKYNLIEYLQKRNPAVPVIPDKIEPPRERKLVDISKFWKECLSFKSIREIYSKKTLSANDISIDHFIPWSYTVSDEFWNLHPTTKKINSCKSNNLPDWNIYFPLLCDLQYTSYLLIHKHPKLMDVFMNTSKNHFSSLEVKERLYLKKEHNKQSFSNALEEVLGPQYLAASSCGFKRWEYNYEF